jgi:hypothetical protein
MSKASTDYLLNLQERSCQTEQDVVLMDKSFYTMGNLRDSE